MSKVTRRHLLLCIGADAAAEARWSWSARSDDADRHARCRFTRRSFLEHHQSAGIVCRRLPFRCTPQWLACRYRPSPCTMLADIEAASRLGCGLSRTFASLGTGGSNFMTSPLLMDSQVNLDHMPRDVLLATLKEVWNLPSPVWKQDLYLFSSPLPCCGPLHRTSPMADPCILCLTAERDRDPQPPPEACRRAGPTLP